MSDEKPDYLPRPGSIAAEIYDAVHPGTSMSAQEIIDAIDSSINVGTVHASMQYAVTCGQFTKLVMDGVTRFYRRTVEEHALWRGDDAKPVDLESLVVAKPLATWFPTPVVLSVAPEPDSPGFSCALYSDGRLVLEVDGKSVTLSKAHADRLVHYLERMTP